ncbi:MAG: hypothetical protein FGF50_09250 [Candidatus Brockarchaeota archaeon]|nr:hypothetical protein [Candidatus Brockarchaeota archaeon]
MVRRRAISPLIATIILIAICVVGGLMVYSVFMSTSSTLAAKGQVSVETVDLVKQTTGETTFSITVKNTGNKPAKSLTVKLAGGAAQNLKFNGENVSDTNPLQPGQSASLVYSPTGTFVVGNSYNIVIEAVFSDGSAFTKTEAVTCRSG